MFTDKVDYFAKIQSVRVVAVAVLPPFTSPERSKCGTRVKKSLLTYTHKCFCCGLVEHRNFNAAKNILAIGTGIEKYGGARRNSNAWGDRRFGLGREIDTG